MPGKAPSTMKPIPAAIACLALVFGSAAWSLDGRGPAAVDTARIVGADAEPGNWMSHGRSYDEQRFSPLDQIDAANVGRLGLDWYADLDLARGEEATPLVVDGILYVSTAWSMVRAFDAATGRPLWTYDPQVPRERLVAACCDAVNRGVAAWKGRIFVGTLDGRLVALDARTGKPVWSVVTVDPAKPYTITGAPRVVRDKVIIGNGGAELGVRGYVTAYDAVTGRKAWRFYTVPGEPGKPDGEISDQPLARAASSWSGSAWWKAGAGGGTAWDAMAYDPKLDLLYIGTGNGSPWSRGARSAGKGDNLYLSSIVALRPDTGAYVWHYQTTPGDEWDYTATQHIVLADLPIGGVVRQVLMQAPKNGFFYVLDRATGKLISAEKYVPANWADRIDPATGRPVENPAARYSETGKPWFGTPGSLGGHNWPPMAYSPRSGLVYIPTQELATRYAAKRDFRFAPLGYNTGIDLGAGPEPGEMASPVAEPKGYLLAWDPRTQRAVWRAPRDTFGNGGVLATAGDLVVQGTGTGFLKIMNATTGRELWSRWLQAGVLAAPIGYAVRGRQYVAVMAGCGGVYGSACRLVGDHERRPNADRLLVFALDGKATLPAPALAQPLSLAPPPLTAGPEVVAHGRRTYAQFCAVCHGFSGTSLGNQPDLRYSPLLGDDVWFDVVLGGALKDAGMAGFAKALDHDDAAAIRAYLIALAREKMRTGDREDRPVEPAHSS
jgi:quinohemoprotein ethanol dehydrogenase